MPTNRKNRGNPKPREVIMWKLVTSGGGAGSLANLQNYEEELEEEQRGKLSLALHFPISSGVAEELESKLRGAGVTDAQVFTEGNKLDIQFRKGFPWLAVIVAVVLGLIVLAVLIVSWQFFKEVKEIVPSPVIIIGIIVGIALVAVLAYMLARRQLPV